MQVSCSKRGASFQQDGSWLQRLMLPPTSTALVRLACQHGSKDVAMNQLTATADPLDTDIIRGVSDRASPRTGGLPSAMRVNNRQGRNSGPRQTSFLVERDSSPIYDQEFEQSADVSWTRSRSPHESEAISQIKE